MPDGMDEDDDTDYVARFMELQVIRSSCMPRLHQELLGSQRI